MRTARRATSLLELLMVVSILGMVTAVMYSTLGPLLRAHGALQTQWNAELALQKIEAQLRADARLAQRCIPGENRLTLENAQERIVYISREQTMVREVHREHGSAEAEAFAWGDDLSFVSRLQTEQEQAAWQLRQPMLVIEIHRALPAPAKLAPTGRTVQPGENLWLQYRLNLGSQPSAAKPITPSAEQAL